MSVLTEFYFQEIKVLLFKLDIFHQTRSSMPTPRKMSGLASLCSPRPPHPSVHVYQFLQGKEAKLMGVGFQIRFFPQLLRKSFNLCETKFPPVSVDMLNIMSLGCCEVQMRSWWAQAMTRPELQLCPAEIHQ